MQGTSTVEGKTYSQTNIFSDLRLQRSKCSNNSARSSEQQDMGHSKSRNKEMRNEKWEMRKCGNEEMWKCGNVEMWK